MAPLPANNTDRYFLDYAVGPNNHTLEQRVAAGMLPAPAADAFDAFLTAIHTLLLEINIIGMRYQAHGSHVSLPVAWTGASSYGTGTPDLVDTTKYISYVGRSADGRRVRATVFGVSNPVADGDFRWENGANAAADAGRSALASFSADNWLTISGQHPTWNNYANVGINAYWRNHVR